MKRLLIVLFLSFVSLQAKAAGIDFIIPLPIPCPVGPANQCTIGEYQTSFVTHCTLNSNSAVQVKIFMDGKLVASQSGMGFSGQFFGPASYKWAVIKAYDSNNQVCASIEQQP